jgi:hypothetical protein
MTPKELTGFKRIWTKISKEVAAESGKALMAGFRKKVRSVGQKGVKQAMVDGDINVRYSTIIHINFI